MKNKIKILAFFIVLALAILACSAFSGGSDTGSSGDANILFEDDFSRESSGWDRENYGDGITDYDNGAYKISIYTDSLFFWASPYQDFDDVIVEVQAQKTSGEDDMQYGLICKHQDVENWYALIVTADGFAAIRKRYAGGELDFITDWAEVPGLNTGNGTNLLRAECIGDRLALYVNGELAIETYDSDITSGDAGLIAGTFEQPSAEVMFDNFIVRQP